MRQGSMLAYDTIFSWMALFVLLLIPLIILLRRPPAQVKHTAADAAGD